MIEIRQIEHRKQELTAQLKMINSKISEFDLQLKELYQKQTATLGAIAALDEILSNPDGYGLPAPDRPNLTEMSPDESSQV
jgi:prefoldin subunit 5